MAESDLDLVTQLRLVAEEADLDTEFLIWDLDEAVAAGCSKCGSTHGGGNDAC